MKPEVLCPTPEATRAHAAALAALLHEGQVILLEGPLGAGKTEWVRGLAHALGYEGPVTSPTFTLCHEYPTPGGTLWHWDLYRLEPGTDWEAIEFDEHLGAEGGWSVIEWPDRFPGPWPDGHWHLRIELERDEIRRICGGPTS